MNVYKIGDALACEYKGAGYALAAVVSCQVVALRYVQDVAPAVVANAEAGSDSHGAFFVRTWLGTAEAGPVVRELQALGEVSGGMCSGWEFCEL